MRRMVDSREAINDNDADRIPPDRHVSIIAPHPSFLIPTHLIGRDSMTSMILSAVQPCSSGTKFLEVKNYLITIIARLIGQR